jgi:DnaJ-class molecular chaperone
MPELPDDPRPGYMRLKYVDGNDEIEFDVPYKNEICSRCNGEGSHLNPNIGMHAYGQEEFEEAFPEPEDKEQYFKRGGVYDVQCETCHGNKVVQVVDRARIQSKEVKAKLNAYDKYKREEARYDHEDRVTRFWENGGRE